MRLDLRADPRSACARVTARSWARQAPRPAQAPPAPRTAGGTPRPAPCTRPGHSAPSRPPRQLPVADQVRVRRRRQQQGALGRSRQGRRHRRAKAAAPYRPSDTAPARPGRPRPPPAASPRRAPSAATAPPPYATRSVASHGVATASTCCGARLFRSCSAPGRGHRKGRLDRRHPARSGRPAPAPAPRPARDPPTRPSPAKLPPTKAAPSSKMLRLSSTSPISITPITPKRRGTRSGGELPRLSRRSSPPDLVPSPRPTPPGGTSWR